MRHLTILTYGRSGSTLLQGVLNAHPGVLVRGENYNVLHDMYRIHGAALTLARRHRNAHAATHPQYGAAFVDPDDVLGRLRELALGAFLRPPAGTAVCGFKEIRYGLDEVPDLEGYLDFLEMLFPGIAFVVNLRDHAAVARSKWWAEMEDARDRLAAMEERFRAAAARRPERTVVLDYDAWVDAPALLAPAFDLIGVPMDAEAVRRTMAVPHSY